MKDDSYLAGPCDKKVQFWWGVVIGTVGGLVGCIPWQAAFVWHLLVAALVGVACGVFTRSFGDRFWYAILGILRFLWHE